jgi:hypothetical protein
VVSTDRDSVEYLIAAVKRFFQIFFMPFWMRKPGASQGKKIKDRKKKIKKELDSMVASVVK